jgi:hypothetical protein
MTLSPTGPNAGVRDQCVLGRSGAMPLWCLRRAAWRSDLIEPHFDLIPCRRNDRLRLTTGGLRLLAREVVLTETVLATPNLGVFL